LAFCFKAASKNIWRCFLRLFFCPFKKIGQKERKIYSFLSQSCEKKCQFPKYFFLEKKCTFGQRKNKMMSRIIAIVNHKGGVGKTTTTLNLGKALSLQGKKVLLIDIDPQANLSQSVGLENLEKNVYHLLGEQNNFEEIVHHISENFDIIPSDLNLSEAEVKFQADVEGYFKLKNALKTVQNEYDFIFIDCPPSLGILTINALIACSEIIVVVLAQFLATKGLNTIIGVVAKINKNLNPTLKILGLLLTQTNRTVLSQTINDLVKKHYTYKVFDAHIRQNVNLAEASTQAMDIFQYSPKSLGAEDYMNLSKEILHG